tara:strand:+ start:636 stop:1169 length:534 start_codon:yes stop_codon:yes gene_type:complete
MINLNTCVKGQKLRLRNGTFVTYVQSGWSSEYPHRTRTEGGECFSYIDEGSYHFDSTISGLDVVEILPLEITDSPKSDKHPSVAWWESCPWITERKPTKEDGNAVGLVITNHSDTSTIMLAHWQSVEAGKSWIHRQDWQPPTLTDREQALQLLDDHRDGWRPSPEQWHVIRKGLEAL